MKPIINEEGQIEMENEESYKLSLNDVIRLGREFFIVKEIKVGGDGIIEANSKKRRYKDLFVR